MSSKSFVVRASLLTASLLGIGVMFAACAKSPVFDDTDSGPITMDPGCPDADLRSDPMHCGTCTNACAKGQVCSQAVCKAACDSPMIKCTSGCADIKTDPLNCGNCAKVCPLAEGGLPPGNGNDPDAGVMPEAGPWDLGMATCTNAMCGIACANGKTNCGGVCVDTSQMHDYCGDCNTQCASDEWCTGGKCCKGGLEANCNGMCVNVASDAMNCGKCGVTCGGNTPYCVNGTCGSLAYATADLQGGNKKIVFLYAPMNTMLGSDAAYANYCKQAFNQNQNGNNNATYVNAMMYSASAYYCNAWCCFLGSGNSMYTKLSNFQNFGLPLNKALQVFDRGCGDWPSNGGTYATGVCTTDSLTVTGNTTFTYQAPQGNYGQMKTLSLSKDGVVVCQAN